jgi:S1-C subfamily serine protease
VSRLIIRASAAGTPLLISALLLMTVRAQDPAPGYLGLGGETVPDGVIVREVAPGGPAAQAGLKVGDLIAKVDGQKVKAFDALAEAVSRHKPGDKLTLSVRRDDAERDLVVTLGSRPGRIPPDLKLFPGAGRPAVLGVQSQALTPELKQRFGLSSDQGALVTEVIADSPAAKAGLKEQDLITALDGQRIANPQELREAVQKAGTGKEVALKIERGKETKELHARLEAAPGPGAGLPRFDRPMIPGLGGDLFDTPAKVRDLEKKVQDLEKRIRDLEEKLSKK